MHQGIEDKKTELEKVLMMLSHEDGETYAMKNVAYCGDDCNDLECMESIKAAGGIIACPVDAVDEVIEVADFVAKSKGGDGAVREFIDWINRADGN